MQSPQLEQFTISRGAHRFHVGIRDIFCPMADVIVNPANGGLAHGAGLAAAILDEAGPDLERDCRRIIQQAGRLPVGSVACTSAGHLKNRAVIHAVGPRATDNGIQNRLEKTITNALTLMDRKGWRSAAFPAISTGIFGVPREVCAKAFVAVPRYWEEHPESCVDEVWLCLTVDDYPTFSGILGLGLI